MTEITKIRKHSSGTAYINIPKKVMNKKDLKEEDNVAFLYPEKKNTIIITNEEDDLID